MKIFMQSNYICRLLGALFVMGIGVTGLYLGDTAMAADQKTVSTPSGLKYIDDTIGTGTEAVTGKTVVVHYTGWIDQQGSKGNKFDSSRDRPTPFEFPLGAGRVIKGWDEGVAGMKIGGKRTLMIPPQLGYGPRGYPPVIPPNSSLIFEVELLKVQ